MLALVVLVVARKASTTVLAFRADLLARGPASVTQSGGNGNDRWAWVPLQFTLRLGSEPLRFTAPPISIS